MLRSRAPIFGLCPLDLHPDLAPEREVFLSAMGEIDYLSYGFAAVVLGGGVVGFVKAGEQLGMGWEAN